MDLWKFGAVTLSKLLAGGPRILRGVSTMSSNERGSVKVVELIGESHESWEDAAQQAVNDASETIEGISGIDIISQTAKVDSDEIVQYRTTVHLSFPVQR